MKERNQVTIGLHRDKYDNLHQMKTALEKNLGRRVDWGTYLMTLASPWSVDAITAVISEERREKSDVSVDHDFISSCVTKEDMKEIVNEVADKIFNEATDKIINALKKHLDSKTGKLAGKDDEKSQTKDYYSRPLEV